MASFPRIPRGKPMHSMPLAMGESSSFVAPVPNSYSGPSTATSAGSSTAYSAESSDAPFTGSSTISGPLADARSSEFINDPIKRLSQERYGKKENPDVPEQPEKDAEIEREKMRVLVSSFSEDQLNRYEMYRRAAFPKAAIKRLMQSVMGGSSVPPNVVIAMAGISKVFVGEVVEEALDFMEKNKQTGPIQPKHLREAVRKLKRKSGIPNIRYKKTLLN